jgi:hypothetical protein
VAEVHVAEEEGRLEQGAVRQSGNVETRRAPRRDGLASPALGVVEKRPDAPCFGTLGRLDYDALSCHICGEWKRNLAQHARLAHRLSADAYRCAGYFARPRPASSIRTRGARAHWRG